MKHITQEQPKPNIVKTRHYNCAYVRLMAVLIIFPVILHTVINLAMLSTGKRGASSVVYGYDATLPCVNTHQLSPCKSYFK